MVGHQTYSHALPRPSPRSPHTQHTHTHTPTHPQVTPTAGLYEDLFSFRNNISEDCSGAYCNTGKRAEGLKYDIVSSTAVV